MSFPSTPFFPLLSLLLLSLNFEVVHFPFTLSAIFSLPFYLLPLPLPSHLDREAFRVSRAGSRAQRDDANRASRRVHASRRERGPGLRAMRSLTHKVNLGLPVSGAGGNPTPPVGGKNREVRVWGTREMGRERDEDREV